MQRTHVNAAMFGVLAALLAYAPFSIDVVLPALPTAMLEFGAGAASFRLVTSATFIGLGIGQAIGGPLSDRIGRRRPALGSAIAFAVAATGCATAQSLLWLQLASAAMGAAAATGIVSARAAIRDYASHNEAAHLLSRLWTFAGFVPVLAPLVGTFVFELGGWRSSYVALAVYGALLAIAIGVRFEETLPHDDRHAGSHGDTVRIARGLLRNRRFMAYSAVLTGGYVTFIGYVSAAPFIIQRQHGWTPVQFGALYALNAFAGVVLTRVNTRRLGAHSAHALLGGGIRLFAIAGAVVLLGGVFDSMSLVILGFMGIAGVWGPMMNNAIALGMSAQAGAAGTASAAMGIMSFTIGGAVSALVGMAGGVGAVTTGAIMLSGTAVAAVAIRYAVAGEQVNG